MKKILFAVILFFTIWGNAMSAAAVQSYLTLGLTGGGDKLGSFSSSDGVTKDIQAGGNFYFGGGIIIKSGEDDKFETALGIGYFGDRVSASNGNVAFTRFPLEAVGYYRISEKVQLGGGLTYHLTPEYDCHLSGSSGCSLDVEFENALGFTFRGEYYISDSALIGLNYTNINYNVKSVNGYSASGSIDGNHLGLMLKLRFY